MSRPRRSAADRPAERARARRAPSQAARGIAPIGVELRTPDLAALAVAMGANGFRTTSTADLPELIAGALDAGGPTLIHLDIR